MRVLAIILVSVWWVIFIVSPVSAGQKREKKEDNYTLFTREYVSEIEARVRALEKEIEKVEIKEKEKCIELEVAKMKLQMAETQIKIMEDYIVDMRVPVISPSFGSPVEVSRVLFPDL